MDAARPPAAKAGDVLHFWLEEVPADKHFARDDALDATIAERFGALHAELAQGVPAHWTADPRSLLAAVIVLDQFSRNLFRDDGRAYAQDAAALALSCKALAAGDDAGMTALEKQFLYMPFMHSEQLADVERSIALMQSAGLDEAEEFARRHTAVIARFGRYPSRNAALGRTSTAEEEAFLADNPSGF